MAHENDEYDGVLGLEHKAIRLHEYTPQWAKLYQQEKERLLVALGTLAVDIQHCGSTAVPGIKAKPILDIMVGIPRFADGPQCIAPLEAIGYDYAPDAGVADDYVFGKGVRRTHLVHVVAYGGPNWTANLRFRDVLRHNPELAREYEVLKVALSQQYADSRAEYTAAKSAFIQRVISDAAQFVL